MDDTAPTYELISDFGVNDAGELLSVSSYWVLAVYRFAYPTTYSRTLQASFTTDYNEAVRIRGAPLVITDCIQVSVGSSKESHMMTLSATIAPSVECDYLSEIMPGDWVFCWMVNDRKKAKDLINRITKGAACNRFGDGLKFMGRVNTMGKGLVAAPSGPITLRYSLNASGFTEFDATLYYDPYLAENIPSLGQFYARIGGDINKLIAENGQGISATKMFLFFFNAFLGKGISSNLGRGNSDPRLQATTGLSGEYSYVIPAPVAAVLGCTQPGKSIFTAADIWETVYGIQNYTIGAYRGSTSPFLTTDKGNVVGDIAAGLLFAPDSPDNHLEAGALRWTGKDVLGVYVPQQPQFSNSSIWSILHQYCNIANEMYTCLRVNPHGQIMPTVIFRQLPFSTDTGGSAASVTAENGASIREFHITRFLELPRWKVHPHLVQSVNISRSDTTRINFVHVYGDTGTTIGAGATFTEQVVRYPPHRDELDIARSGLRNYSATIPCAPADIINNDAPETWMALLSDFLIGQQLTLTGSMELIGIEAPICQGDNIEWDGNVFHIESVNHRAMISPSGQKMFTTSLSLSHGMSANPSSPELGVYPDINTPRSPVGPGLTDEGSRRDKLLPEAMVLDPYSVIKDV